jgi:hypothetical protein
MPATLRMQMFRGEDRLWTFVPVPGMPGEDITGWTIVATFWSQATPPQPIFIKSTTNGGIVITQATKGYFTLTISAADTTAPLLAPGAYPADIWRTDSGFERIIANGTLSLATSPTH